MAPALALALTACAAPLRRVTTTPAPVEEHAPPVARRATGRPTVGVAFGGGSARGIAHVGVIRWFEEHRIPIDVAAGTSMGGLIGGAFATGMDASELGEFIESLDWDRLFGASTFAYKNIRRKTDARAYPARLEFGLRGGIVPPSALNNGQYVELLLGRIAAPYFATENFDDLPTPFRTVAADLVSSQAVVMRRGSLADAMRATMSLPLIFPPVEVDGRVLVDGGIFDNVPADVVKDMGATRVVAVNVGDLSDNPDVSYAMFSVAGSTLDAMTKATTKRALASADVVVNVPLKKYGSLDWRRAADLVEEGYRAAEAMRDQLLPLALSEADYAEWRRQRQERRQTELPSPSFVHLDGFVPADAGRLEALLARHVGVALDVDALEQDIATLGALDRYETVTWRVVPDAQRGPGLSVRGRAKLYAPPFLLLGLNVENTTSTDFGASAAARYLGFDVAGSGSELRVDGTIGSNPSAAAELYRPLGTTPLFVAPYAGVEEQIFNRVVDDAVTARYDETTARLGVNAGINLGAFSDLRLGPFLGHEKATIEVGDPGFPELRGREIGAQLVWRLDTQDTPVVPSGGLSSELRLLHLFDGPDAVVAGRTVDTNDTLTQASVVGNHFWSAGPRRRVFAYVGFGTSFDSEPLPTQKFELGALFRLGAYGPGELRGAHYYVGTVGYLQRIGRLPDFMGGPVFAGAWLENGDAFDEWNQAGIRTNGGAGVIMDTIAGPLLLAGSWGFDGRWRTYFGIGRLFSGLRSEAH
jgi:NTE family protein